MVRYYGYYSNASRGKHQREGLDDATLCILEPQGNEWAFRKSWARLIQKIYEVDLLVCPKTCPEPAEGFQVSMRIISFIKDQSVIRDIRNHLGLSLARARPPPKVHAGAYKPLIHMIRYDICLQLEFYKKGRAV